MTEGLRAADERDDSEPEALAKLLAAVDRARGSPCNGCSRAICGHEVVVSFVLGFKETPRCLDCLARGLSRERGDLLTSARHHIDHRDCWSAGWRHATAIEERSADAGTGASGTVSCGLGAVATCIAGAPAAAKIIQGASRGTRESASDRTPEWIAEWDAGDLACGDLVLELRLRLRELQSGQILKLTARDPGAPADLPAWCGLNGHTLITAAHPIYLIQRRTE